MRLTAAACLAMLAGGCALIDQKVPLRYSKEPTLQARGTGPIAIARPAEPSLHENKKGQTIIGTVRNGYGMETASSVTEDSVGQWIADAFRKELAAAGYDAKVVDRLPAGCPRGIQIEVDKIWVDQDGGWWTVGGIGHLDFKMTLVRNGSPAQQIELLGRGQHRGAFGDTDPKARALEKALQQCLKKAVPYVAAATAKG